MIKAEGDPNGSILPATGQKEVVMQWHDVDVVRGTQYTVTGYQIPVEGDKVGRGRRGEESRQYHYLFTGRGAEVHEG